MGSFLSGILGTDSKYKASPYQAGNPYGRDVLQQDVNNQAQIYAQQQALAQQLQDQMSGKGPNPAQQQYQQNVQQNIAQGQGLIASQRGLNPALAAKMGANAASQASQQAAGQSGIMQAQQQLNATNELGGLYGQEQAGNLGQQGLYTAANNAAMGTNAAVAGGNQQSAKGITGGLLGGIGSALGLKLASGGQVPNYADGGMSYDSSGPQSFAGKFLNSMGGTGQDPLQMGISSLGGGISGFAKNHLGSSPAPASTMTTPDTWSDYMQNKSGMQSGSDWSQMMKDTGSKMAHGGKARINFKPGGKVPGKASAKGDSLKNDTVPAMLSPGEVVIPRSIATDDQAPEKAKRFVAALLAKNNFKKKGR